MLTFTAPLSQTNPIAKSFIQHFSQPSFLDAIPSYFWIPTDALLTYDAVSAFAKTASNEQNTYFTQNDFNTYLSHITLEGVSGQITFQGDRNNGHSSDRDQGYIYITCTDLAHNIHLITRYSTVNDGNSLPQELSLSQADGASACIP
jgi:hypothetical protein